MSTFFKSVSAVFLIAVVGSVFASSLNDAHAFGAERKGARFTSVDENRN